MRILYLSPRDCWPVTTGARQRDLNLARQLARRASSLTYVGFTSGEGRPPALCWREPLASLEGSPSVLVRRDGGYSPWRMLRGLLGPTPITVGNYSSAKMERELRRLLGEEDTFDLAQIEGVHMYSYVDVIRQASPRTRIMCDWHNIESELLSRYSGNAPLLKRLYASRTATLLERFERRLLEQCDAHVVCSSRERSILLRRLPGARIQVTGNGVDVAFHSDAQIEAACRRQPGIAQDPRKSLLFVGSMDYHANIDAVQSFAAGVWRPLHQSRTDLRFVIAGSRPVAAVQALAQQPGITVTGTVEDVRPYYRGALAVVVPVRVGSGTRLKVLEAMAAGVPVISTTLGAEGLEVVHGENILLADSRPEMLNAIALVEGSASRWQRLADEGRKLVTARYDWEHLGQCLYRFYEQQLAEARR